MAHLLLQFTDLIIWWHLHLAFLLGLFITYLVTSLHVAVTLYLAHYSVLNQHTNVPPPNYLESNVYQFQSTLVA